MERKMNPHKLSLSSKGGVAENETDGTDDKYLN